MFYGAKERTWERGWGREAWGRGLRHLIFRVWEMEAPADELLAKLTPAGPRNIIFEADDSRPKLIFRALRLRSVSGVNLPMTLKGFAIIDTNSSQLLLS